MSTKTIIAIRHSWWVDLAIALLSRYEVMFGKPQHKGILDWIAKHGVRVIYINEIEEKEQKPTLGREEALHAIRFGGLTDDEVLAMMREGLITRGQVKEALLFRYENWAGDHDLSLLHKASNDEEKA